MKKFPGTSGTIGVDAPLVEVVDRQNRMLAALPMADVLRQQLCHRSVIILLYDEAGRLFLRKLPPRSGQGAERWDLPVRGPVLLGESLQDAATRALESELGIHAERFRQMQVIAPSTENGNEHQHVFSLVRPEDSGVIAKAGETEGFYFSREELGCLLRDFRELISARLLMLAQVLQIMPKRRRPQ